MKSKKDAIDRFFSETTQEIKRRRGVKKTLPVRVVLGVIGVCLVSVSAWIVVHHGGLLLFGRPTIGRVVRQTKAQDGLLDATWSYRAIAMIETRGAPIEIQARQREVFPRYPIGANVPVIVLPWAPERGYLKSDLAIKWPRRIGWGLLGVVMMGMSMTGMITSGRWRIPRRLDAVGRHLDRLRQHTPLKSLHITFRRGETFAIFMLVPIGLVGVLLIGMMGINMIETTMLSLFGRQIPGVVVDQQVRWENMTVGFEEDADGESTPVKALRECYYAIISYRPDDHPYGPYQTIAKSPGIGKAQYPVHSQVPLIYLPGHSDDAQLVWEAGMEWKAVMFAAFFGFLGAGCLGAAVAGAIMTHWVTVHGAHW